MEQIAIGSVIIQVSWLMYAFSVIVGYIVLQLQMNKYPDVYKEVTDTAINSILIYIVVFKFSIILLRPTLLFENPLGLLYFDGGGVGVILGILSILIYVAWKIKTITLPNILLVRVYSVSVASSLFVYLILHTIF
ncbi:hypothetical protein EJF36_09755 [Bacillus sp. HMF5848]|uniref:hypothetical protein n=1 Tax=Bacillus sp. HMF5848 TaxID=2495421 RepID=UPI000F7951F3|nr:hypothetical protein [Bacillus sp. HMF5848]RSK27139.1 hypothetical protein EJF36_09755 [Bacillus sp. HMF5848]